MGDMTLEKALSVVGQMADQFKAFEKMRECLDLLSGSQKEVKRLETFKSALATEVSRLETVITNLKATVDEDGAKSVAWLAEHRAKRAVDLENVEARYHKDVEKFKDDLRVLADDVAGMKTKRAEENKKLKEVEEKLSAARNEISKIKELSI